ECFQLAVLFQLQRDSDLLGALRLCLEFHPHSLCLRLRHILNGRKCEALPGCGEEKRCDVDGEDAMCFHGVCLSWLGFAEKILTARSLAGAEACGSAAPFPGAVRPRRARLRRLRDPW